MNTARVRILTVCLAGALGAIAPTSAIAAPPPLVPLQGVMVDAMGVPLDGLLPVDFRLYGDELGADVVWEESQILGFNFGVFSTYLGAVEPLVLEIFRDNHDLWLGITVDDDDEMNLIRIATAPFAGYAEYAGFADVAMALEGFDPNDFAPAGHGHDWSEITGIPEDLLDGDDDTTYDAGFGLMLDGTTFAADPATLQVRVDGTCPEGSYMVAVGADGAVSCVGLEAEVGTISSVTAGDGLLGGGETGDIALEVDFGAVQALVTGLCPAGFAMVAISADGSVVCDIVPDGDITDVIAGFGLLGGGDVGAVELEVDPTEFQVRVEASCPAGSSIRSIGEDGSVVCHVDVDTNTTYTPGLGLTLTGTTFSADTAILQRRVAGACPVGSSVRVVNADGSVVCHTDADTTYGAGTGLALDGTTFAIDPTATQVRVAGECPAGSSIQAVAADGTVTCHVDVDTDTTYGAGLGLTLTGTTFAVSPTVFQRRVTGTCPAGSSIQAVAADGTVTCHVDVDTDTTYSPGLGLTLTETTFAVSPTVFQRRVTGTCPVGSSIRTVAADGTVTCHVDADTTYGAGAGLTLTGTTFAVDATTVQRRVTGACAPGSSIRAVAADGTVTCQADTNTTYGAGTGLSLTGTTFAVDTSVVQSRVTGACAVGSSVRAIAADGSVTCQPDTNTTYDAGAGLSLTGTTFSIDPTAVQARVTGTCPVGSSIRAIGAGGTVTCQADTNTTYGAGTGLSLEGTTFSVDPATVQTRVAASCPAGQSIRVINADGTVACQVDTNTTYAAGTGLSLTGTTFAVDGAVFQRRVTGGCPEGSYVRVINADGSVDCQEESDSSVFYSAGAGLSLEGTTFSVDPTAVQTRVAGTCPVGSSIRAIGVGGAVTCQPDTNTTYGAGAGMSLVGTTFSVDPEAVQTRVAASCPAGQSIRVINADGTVGCQVDSNTTYVAGTGLSLTGTTFAADTTFLQRRVTGDCPDGTFVREINADGSVDCAEAPDSGVAYSAGTGLVLTGTTFSTDTAFMQRRVGGTCPVGSSIRVIAVDGTVTCQADANTTYGAGTGLSLTGTTFAIDPTAVQARVAGVCAVGSSIRAVAADGTVTCQADTNTTYAAGTGLSLTGTTFSADTAFMQRRVAGTCPVGSSIRVIAVDGTVTCQADANTTYSAGTGLSLEGTTFEADTSVLQRRVDTDCGTGSAIRAIGEDGSVLCEPSGGGGIFAGAGLFASGATGGTTIGIESEGVQDYMLAWGVPNNLSFFPIFPTPSCGAQFSQSTEFAGFTRADDYVAVLYYNAGPGPSVQHPYRRARFQATCRGLGEMLLIDSCETVVATIPCSGSGLPYATVSEEFEPRNTVYHVLASSSGGVLEWAMPQLVVY